MDSDRNSNRFLGFRQAKSLPLMDKTSFLAMLLLLFIIADVSNASVLTKHRFLITDPPRVNPDGSTLPGKDSPVASPPPPAKPDPKLVNDAMNNKTEPAPPVKMPDPNLDPKVSDNSAKSGSVPTLTENDGKNNQTQKNDSIPEDKRKKNPTPDDQQKPEDNPTTDPELKPKGVPTTDPDEKPKEDPTTDPAKKPIADPIPDPELKPEGGKEKIPEERTKSNNETVTNVPNVKEESCDGESKTCRNLDMVACIKSSNQESTEADILVKNLHGSKLNATISAEDTRVVEIRKHKYKKIKLNVGKSNKIVVKIGHGECELQMDSFVPEGNFFIHFPSYEKVVTRINGAYFLIVTVIIFGGTWACCLIRRRKQRTGGGVPYQELEMALPESASATDVVTAEGWDQGWDDDWDDNAVKSPVGHLAGSISANGLTARSSNKDGWENNWDD